MSGPVPDHVVAERESASWATPHVAEEVPAAFGAVVPVDRSTVVAEADAVDDSAPVGTGDPLAHTAELVVTVPPAPVPVDQHVVAPVVPSSCNVPVA